MWKTIEKFASNRSVAATFVLALTAALVGGFLNSAQEGESQLLIFLHRSLFFMPYNYVNEGVFIRAIVYAGATGTAL